MFLDFLQKQQQEGQGASRRQAAPDPLSDPLSDPMGSDPLFKEQAVDGMSERTKGHDRVTVADVDGDGREDVVFSRSADPNAKDESLRHAHHVVYRNTEEGLVDYTEQSGIENLPADQLLFGDLDNDGDQDIVGLQRSINNPDADGEGFLKHTVFEQGTEDSQATWTANNDLLKGIETVPTFPAISGRLRDVDGDGRPDLIMGTSAASGTREDMEKAGFPNLDKALLKEEPAPAAPTAEELEGLDEAERQKRQAQHEADLKAWEARETDRKAKLEKHQKQTVGAEGPVMLVTGTRSYPFSARSTHYDATVTDLGGKPRDGAEVLTGSYGVSSKDKGHNQLLSRRGDLTAGAGDLAASAKGNPVNPKSKGKTEPTSGGPVVGGNTMSLATADMDNDGDMDIIEANISHRSEFTTLAAYRKAMESRGQKHKDDAAWKKAWEESSHDRRWADPSRLLLNTTGDAASEAEAEATRLEASAAALEKEATAAESDAKAAEGTDEHAALLATAQTKRAAATAARADATAARAAATEARKAVASPTFEDASEDWGLPYAEGDIQANAADLDNDGRQDIIMGQTAKYGHGEGGVKVYLQAEAGTLTEQTDDQSGLGATTEAGHVLLDLDNDGDLDMVTSGPDGGKVFTNQKGQDNNWIAIQVVGGQEGISVDAFGARITLTVGKLKLTREVEGGGHDGQSDTRWLHFGLGKADHIDKIEFETLSGEKQKGTLPVDAFQLNKRHQVSADGGVTVL